MTGQTWTLAFPAPDKMHTTNTAKNPFVASTARRTWRDAMHTYLKQHKLPKGLTRIRVDIELRFPTNSGQEASNYHPLVAKPIVDATAGRRQYRITKGRRAGTVVTENGYGLIPDDNPKRHLHCEDCPHIRISDALGPKPFGELIVIITDYSEAPDA